MHVKKLIAAMAVTGGLLAGGLATAAPASAHTADCTFHQVCLYYSSSTYGFGAYYRQTADVSNYAGKYFKAGNNGSTGAGVEVKNNAAAIDSWLSTQFTIYYNSGYNCDVVCQIFDPYATFQNLSSQLKNNNASGRVPPSAGW
ncbi:hypothetical protein K353_06573 [Kitasatospora sp. SolWspMP-SS2h]|uniref:hypothetical protein n=1 Tax=Kitasatospora sp. SolWspMP-SS2h TaxID=1305729 RepID=UPI000DBFFAAC|nr:hypothetical protein [Kitasatospora sp. SolWspMP-SS2h]RAJ29685.1 hypothetical protein K353_06573 [Kitasatospora sp. SolWspMP-SS2h]